MSLLERLDESQRKAATAPNGFTRVIAGAGTGKTTTLVARAAHLVLERNTPPGAITAVTFTRKAAHEIKERLRQSVGDQASYVRIGTFHSLSLQILKRHWEAAGMQDRDFLIIDDKDADEIVEVALEKSGAFGEFEDPGFGADAKEVKNLRDEWEKEKRAFASMCGDQIRRWKEAGLTVSDILSPTREKRSDADEMMAAVYVAYQNELELRNVLDFPDLLLRVNALFEKWPDIQKDEASRIQHLLVDEFQDTNLPQCRWIQLLTSVHENLFVVGDPDQSIYAFRGASPETVFEMMEGRSFDTTLIVNRRSVQPILDVANLAVDHVDGRLAPKELRSDKSDDTGASPVRVSEFLNEHAEAAYIANEIQRLKDKGQDLNEIAVLFRVTRSMRKVEETLLKKRIPYRIHGSTGFMDREEVRDVIAMLKTAANLHLEPSFNRIASRFANGVGDVAIGAITQHASTDEQGYVRACYRFVADPPHRTSAKAIESVGKLADAMEHLNELTRDGMPARTVMNHALSMYNYDDYLEKKFEKDRPALLKKRENISILQSLTDDTSTVYDFLNELALYTEVDEVEEDRENRVNLMTIHAAKGLEFDVVFCPNFVDDIIPHVNAKNEDGFRSDWVVDPWNGPRPGGIDEERRLVHVAFSRARASLYVSWPTQMTVNGKTRRCSRSPFISELELTERIFYAGKKREEEEERVDYEIASAPAPGAMFG